MTVEEEVLVKSPPATLTPYAGVLARGLLISVLEYNIITSN